jgi:hypothetical protein
MAHLLFFGFVALSWLLIVVVAARDQKKHNKE